MAEHLQNTVGSTIDMAAGFNSTETALTVSDGSVFAAPNFRLVIENEILICTARASDVLTVTRGQEGTTATCHANGTNVWGNLTAGGLVQYVSENGGGTGLPAGGTAGQALVKQSGTDGDADWETLSGGGGGGGGAFVGVQSHLSANYTLGSGNTDVLALNVNDFDSDGFWSSGDNTKFTVPAGKGGYYRILARAAQGDPAHGSLQVLVKKNGSTTVGLGQGVSTNDGSTWFYTECDVVVSLADGDYVTMSVHQVTATSNTIKGGTALDTGMCMFLIEGGSGDVLPVGGTTGQVLTKQSGTDGDADWETPSVGGGTPTFVGCRIEQGNVSGLTHGADVSIVLATEVIDTNGFWSSGSPTQVIVPSGKAGYYRLTGQFCIDPPATGYLKVWITVNGTQVTVADIDTVDANAIVTTLCATCIALLAVGDIVVLHVQFGGAFNYGGHGSEHGTFLEVNLLGS